MTPARETQWQNPGTGHAPSAVRRPSADRRFTAIGVAALLATAATVAAVALAVGGGRPGWPGTVAWAAAVCLPGSLAAWLVARRQATVPARAVAQALAATVLRIIPPLAGLAWLSAGLRAESAAASGGMLVGFYLSLLAIDIVLHMMGSPRPRSPANRPD